MVRKIRKDVFFRVLARDRGRVRVIKKWGFDPQIDGITYEGHTVPVDAFLAFVGPSSPNYKSVVVYENGDGTYAVFDRWGGQLYSYTVGGLKLPRR
jgi:hypothetical protein